MPEELKRRDDREQPTLTQKMIMGASALVTAFLLGYLAWQIAVLPDGSPPSASVLRVENATDGRVFVHVALENGGSVGLREATVEVLCDEPAPELTLSHVPAHGTRTGTVVCPPGTQWPEVQVSSWIPT